MFKQLIETLMAGQPQCIIYIESIMKSVKVLLGPVGDKQIELEVVNCHRVEYEPRRGPEVVFFLF